MVCFIADQSAIQRATRTLTDGYPQLVPAVRFVEYSQLLSLESIPPGTYVFTDTIKFDADRRTLAVLVEKQMRQWDSKYRIVNSPLMTREAIIHLKENLAGRLMSDLKPASKLNATLVQNILAPGTGAPATDSADLASSISDLLLSGTDPSQIGLFKGELEPNHVLILGRSCLPLSGKVPVSSAFVAKFGMDFLSLEFTQVDGKEFAIALSDHLDDLFPATKAGSPISKAIAQAILSLDTPRESESISLKPSWQALAQAIDLKCPSSAC